jgi:hypothetical protein
VQLGGARAGASVQRGRGREGRAGALNTHLRRRTALHSKPLLRVRLTHRACILLTSNGVAGQQVLRGGSEKCILAAAQRTRNNRPRMIHVREAAPGAELMATIFLSHASTNLSTLQPMIANLRGEGHTVLVSGEHLKPGDPIFSWIDANLARADFMILCWSAEARASQWVGAELDAVRQLNIETGSNRLIPLMLDDTPLPLTVRTLKRIELASASALDELRNALGARATSAAAPAGAYDLAWAQLLRRCASDRRRLLDATGALSYALWQQQDVSGGFTSLPYPGFPPTGHDTGQALVALLGCEAVGIAVDPARTHRALTFMLSSTSHWEPSARLKGTLLEQWKEFQEGRALQPGYTVAYGWVALAAARAFAIYQSSESLRLLRRMRALLLALQLESGAFSFCSDILNEGRASAYATAMAVWSLHELACSGADDDGVATEACGRGASWLEQAFLAHHEDEVTAIRPIPGLREQTHWILSRVRAHERASKDAVRPDVHERVRNQSADCIIGMCEISQDGERCSLPFNATGSVLTGINTQKDRMSMYWLPWATLASFDLVREPVHASQSIKRLQTVFRSLVAGLAGMRPNPATSRYDASEYLFAMAEAAKELDEPG